jgi:DHA3 family macrolide efflux protein-like MFS transporter
MIQSFSGIAGPALGTLAISYFPISKVLYIDIIGALVAITSLFFVSIPHIKREKTKPSISSVITELKEGMQTVYTNKGLSYLFLFAMIVTFFIMPVAIIFPLLTTGHYEGGKWEMGIIEIIWGVGMLIGGSILGIMRIKTSKIILINSMHIIIGLTFLFSGLLPGTWFIGFVILTAFGGIGLSIFSAAFMTILQEEVSPDKLGRIFSLYFSIAVLPSIVGLLFTGIIAETIGVPFAFVISGILVILVGVISFFIPSLMQLGRKK